MGQHSTTQGKVPQGKGTRMPRGTHLVKTLQQDSSSERTTTSERLSNNETGSSTHKKRRKRHSKSSLSEEFKKEKPPTFDGEIKKGEEAEAWLLGLKKYF
jgi:hypothetical protein